MIFRLGYVAMTLSLKDCSPSGTVTVTTFGKLRDEEAKMYRLRRLTRENLKNTLRILYFNQAYNIRVFRFTSKLVPLATHPMIEGWDYAREFESEFKAIGDFVKENDFRVSAHPDHFTLINSESDKVLEDSIRDLDYHVKIYEAMGLDDYRYKLVLHVGGTYKDKTAAIGRFKKNFSMLPDRIRRRIIVENDDKSYTASDVLAICNDLKLPMVLDVHHHNCVNRGERLQDLLPDIFATWDGEYFKPKIHFSSPRDCKNFRSHADRIAVGEFKGFLGIARSVGKDFDVMLEAKDKEMALLKLSEGLEKIENIRRINEGEFEIL